MVNLVNRQAFCKNWEWGCWIWRHEQCLDQVVGLLLWCCSWRTHLVWILFCRYTKTIFIWSYKLNAVKPCPESEHPSSILVGGMRSSILLPTTYGKQERQASEMNWRNKMDVHRSAHGTEDQLQPHTVVIQDLVGSKDQYYFIFKFLVSKEGLHISRINSTKY